MPAIPLTALDPQNPLAFFTALGLLRVLHFHALTHQRELPKLSFANDGSFIPSIHTHLTFDEISEVILEDARASANDSALQIAYTKDGEPIAHTDANAICDLKPPPQLAKSILEQAALGPRRSSDLIAGFFSELIPDNNGNTKPTSFYFTAGQQTFLSMVERLRQYITHDDIKEALIGPWINQVDKRKLPSLSWDSSVSRAYALRASDPSKDPKGTIPAANWLAVHSLAFFPVCVRHHKLETTCVKGGWKDSVFTWPVWEFPASVPVAASILRINPRKCSVSERSAFGIISVFSSKILRSDQGGYGSFTPAEVVYPNA